MSNLIVAKFDNQFAASSAFDKLMSRGLPRRKGVVQCDESVGGSAASASSPTTVVSRVSHRGERGKEHHLRAPDVLPPPMEIGFAVLSVEIDDDSSLEEVMAVMRELEAIDVHILAGESLTEDDASLWPEQAMGDLTDVERAIRASQQGKHRLH